MKRIIIACGTGMATSTMISERVKKILEANDIPFQIVQCQLSEIEMNQKNADLIVTSMKVDGSYDVPVVVGTPFLIGINEEATRQKILDVLKDE